MKLNKIVSFLFLLGVTVGFNVDRVNAFFQNPGTNQTQTKPVPAIRVRALGPVTPGRETTLSLELESSGKVNVVSFTLNFDQSVFTYISTSLGADKPETAHLALNTQQTAAGKLGVLVDAQFPFAAGNKQMATAVFKVTPDARPGNYAFSFGSSPARQGVATTDVEMLDADYETGSVLVGPERKAIVGRILDQDWAGVWHAKVTLKGPDGKEKTYITGPFGSFIFDDLPNGTYTISAASKRYSFAAQTVEVKGTFTEIAFVEAT